MNKNTNFNRPYLVLLLPVPPPPAPSSSSMLRRTRQIPRSHSSRWTRPRQPRRYRRQLRWPSPVSDPIVACGGAVRRVYRHTPACAGRVTRCPAVLLWCRCAPAVALLRAMRKRAARVGPKLTDVREPLPPGPGCTAPRRPSLRPSGWCRVQGAEATEAAVRATRHLRPGRGPSCRGAGTEVRQLMRAVAWRAAAACGPSPPHRSRSCPKRLVPRARLAPRRATPSPTLLPTPN